MSATTTTLHSRFSQITSDDHTPTIEEAAALYADAEPVTIAWLLGEWSGGIFAFGLPVEEQLRAINWAGKSFVSADDVSPIVCFDANGERFANPILGAAHLVEVDDGGSTTVAMVYDQMPVADHFRRISDDVVIGAMHTEGSDEIGYFYLTRLDS